MTVRSHSEPKLKRSFEELPNNRETATINFFIKAELKLEIKQDPLLAKTTGLAEEDSDETRIASLPESTKDGFWWGWCSLSLE